MTTWTQINTGTSATYEFETYGNFAFAQGCFADGEINEGWATINTNQTANWIPISTGSISSVYDFNPYATLAFGEGCFADGEINEPWAVIPTVN
jgi:hypothetical protein